jgi:dTDP-4-amino-4,6-dideoxygalactose transaminase
MPVHLYGEPAELGTILELARVYGLRLVEDCAQSHGALYRSQLTGSFGDVACFSFYPTKNLGALGDGGAVVSTDPDLVARARALRVYGWTREAQLSELPNGRCSRLDEIQAALLLVKLPHLEAWNERRRAIAAAYRQGLAGLPLALPVERPGARHVYHLYVVRSPARDALQAALLERGIRTGRHYPYPGHLQPGLAAGARLPAPLTTTERLQREILSLPIFPSMSDAQVERTIAAVRDAVRHV